MAVSLVVGKRGEGDNEGEGDGEREGEREGDVGIANCGLFLDGAKSTSCSLNRPTDPSQKPMQRPFCRRSSSTTCSPEKNIKS